MKSSYSISVIYSLFPVEKMPLAGCRSSAGTPLLQLQGGLRYLLLSCTCILYIVVHFCTVLYIPLHAPTFILILIHSCSFLYFPVHSYTGTGSCFATATVKSLAPATSLPAPCFQSPVLGRSTQPGSNKEERLSCLTSRYKLTASRETDKTELPCGAG